MAAHIKKRRGKGRNSYYYLVDGGLIRSLETTKKGIAEQLLKQYTEGKLNLEPLPTVKEFYTTWIETKIPPLFRPAQQRDYRQHFTKHILVKWIDGEGHKREFGPMRLDAIDTGMLIEFRDALLRKGLSVKTARNVIDWCFRALYRDARAKHRELQGRDPFLDIQWPRIEREKPDPFTAEERDRIVEHWIKNDFFYYPWVFTLFHTGMRPSEASALVWDDIDLERGTISITKSRYMGDDSAPKTSASNRTIKVSETVIEAFKLLPSKALGLKHVFVNKDGQPMNAKKWSEHNWGGPLKALEIRHRKFYATRHTFITEMINKNEKPLAVAQYCGTSVAMIEKDYCGTLGLSALNQTKIEPGSNQNRTRVEAEPKNPENPYENMVAGPGFEPGTSRL